MHRQRPPPSTTAFDEIAFWLTPLAVMLAAAVAALVCGWRWTADAAAVPWIVSLAVVGLPHGAADMALTRRLCGRRATAGLFALYVAGMAAVLGLFLLAPVSMIVLFTAASIWHFGMAHADGQVPTIVPRLGPRLIAAVGRGATVLAVPMAVWPEATAVVAVRLTDLVGRRATSAAESAAAAFDPAAVRTTGLWLIAAGLVALTIEAFAARKAPDALRRSAATLADLAVIGLLGATAAPLFSVGVYFLTWHSWRQMRLLAPIVAGGAPSGPASLAAALAAIHRAALPLLLPTLAAVLAGWWGLSPDHSTTDLAILSLMVYLVVTPSHDLLIDFLRGRIVADDRTASRRPATASRSCAA